MPAPPRITITPDKVELEPEIPVTVTAEVFNASDIVEEFNIDLVGVERRFRASVEPTQLDLFPGTSGTVEVTFDVQRLYSARAGSHKIGVRATPSTSPHDSRVEEMTIEVMPVSELLLEAHPQMARVGRAAAFVLVVRNRGNSLVEVTFGASDPEGALNFDFDRPSEQVPPGEEIYAVVEAKGRRPIIGQDAQRTITFRTEARVLAHRDRPDEESPEEADEIPEVMADVVMMQRPWLAGIFSTLFVLIIAAVLFAAAFWFVSSRT